MTTLSEATCTAIARSAALEAEGKPFRLPRAAAEEVMWSAPGLARMLGNPRFHALECPDIVWLWEAWEPPIGQLRLPL